MKYYSENLNKMYDTQEELEKAEKAVEKKAYLEKQEKEKKAMERKVRAAEVEETRQAMVAAQTKYREVLEAFCKDYGTYHTSISGEDAKKIIPSLFDIFNPFFF